MVTGDEVSVDVTAPGVVVAAGVGVGVASVDDPAEVGDTDAAGVVNFELNFHADGA